MSMKQPLRGKEGEINGDSSPEPFTILIGDDEAENMNSPTLPNSKAIEHSNLKLPIADQENPKTDGGLTFPGQGDPGKKGFFELSSGTLNFNSSKKRPKIDPINNTNENKQISSSGLLNKNAISKPNGNLNEIKSSKLTASNQTGPKPLSNKTEYRLNSNEAKSADVKKQKVGQSQIVVIEDEELDKKLKSQGKPKSHSENLQQKSKRPSSKLEIIALDEEEEAPLKKMQKSTPKNETESHLHNFFKDDVNFPFNLKADTLTTKPTIDPSELLNRKLDESKFPGVLPPRAGDPLLGNPLNRTLSEMLNNDFSNRMFAGQMSNPLGLLQNLQMASLLANTSPAFSKSPFQSMSPSAGSSLWANYPLNYLSMMQNMPQYPPSLTPNFLLMNPLLQRKYNLLSQFPDQAPSFEPSFSAAFPKMQASSSMDIDFEKSFKSNKIQEESSREGVKNVQGLIHSNEVFSEKSKTTEIEKEQPKKKNKIVIPKVIVEKPKLQEQKRKIFEIRYNKKRPPSYFTGRTEHVTSESTVYSQRSIDDQKAEEYNPLEKNIENKEIKQTRKAIKSNFVPPILSSYLTERPLKPRRRKNKLQVIAEERDKLLEEYKVLEKLKNEAEKEAQANDGELYYEPNGSPLGSEYSFRTKEKNKIQKTSARAKVGKNYQAVVPEFQLSNPERTRKFKKIWNPDEIDNSFPQDFVDKAGAILEIDWCRQDFLFRLLKHNDMNVETTLDILSTNKDYFANLFKSKWIL